MIREKINSGLYADPAQAIDAAVRLLDEHDRRLARLRAALAEGEEGTVTVFRVFHGKVDAVQHLEER